jgi:V/A-type H+/Na+-transporting ATPase subunit E
MSDQALQQVIAELKSRGLRAGEEEAAGIVTQSKEEAAKIVSDANAQAQKILDDARAEAESMRAQLAAELKQASAVGLESFRQAVESSFLVPTVDAGTRSVLDDPAILTQVILETARGFAASSGGKGDLEVILPADQQSKLDAAFVAALKKGAVTGVKVTFADGFDFGFKVSPEGSGYVFDFTEEGFREIFLKFLAPRFRKYFYAE